MLVFTIGYRKCKKVKQTAIKARKRYCEPHFLFILIIVYVKAVLADDSGNVESNQDSKVQVTVEGGKLLGFGSANPRTEDRFDAGEYTTYYGNALAVIRVTDANVVTVQAKTEDGSWVECRIPVI